MFLSLLPHHPHAKCKCVCHRLTTAHIRHHYFWKFHTFGLFCLCYLCQKFTSTKKIALRHEVLQKEHGVDINDPYVLRKTSHSKHLTCDKQCPSYGTEPYVPPNGNMKAEGGIEKSSSSLISGSSSSEVS